LNFKRIFGLLVIIAGVALMMFSNYLDGRLADADRQISDAKKKIQQGDQLFSLNPVSKEIGGAITGSAKQKVRSGEEEVAYYRRISMYSHNGGIALIVIGAVIVIFGRKKK